MEQNNQRNEVNEISLFDIFGMFEGKLKKLVILTLIVAMIGGVIGCVYGFLTLEYTSEITFYSSNLIYSKELLFDFNSQSFAEKLILNENGLPDKEYCNAEDYEKALAAVEAYDVLREKKKESSKAIQRLNYELDLAAVNTHYTYLATEYNRVYKLLETYKLAYDEMAKVPEHRKMMAALEAELLEISAEKKAYEDEVYHPVHEQIATAERDYAILNIEHKEARLLAEELTEVVLNQWRQNEDVQKLIEKIDAATTYKYTVLESEEEDKDDKKKDDTVDDENKKGEFFTVTVSVKNNGKLATFIIDSIKKNLPSVVEKAVEVSTGASSPRCYIHTPHARAEASIVDVLKQGIIFAIVAGVVVAGGYCAVVVFGGMSKMHKKSSKD